MLLLLAVYGPIHVTTKLITGRSNWPPRFLFAVGWAVGLRVRVVGAPIRPHTLLISNHLSWLDIVVLGGSTGCAFVAKDNLGHGLIHWLADQNHTVYVRREDRRGARNQALTIAQALEREQPVALFPEGTTGRGDQMLPFRSTLLEAAALAARDVQIRPVALDYGDATMEVGWQNEGGMDNAMRILGRRGTIHVTIRVLEPLAHSGDRKQIALAARDAIATSLASSRGSPPLYPAA